MKAIRKLGSAFRLLKTRGVRGFLRVLSRSLSKNIWSSFMEDALQFARTLDFSEADVRKSREVQSRHRGKLDVKSCLWFVPDFTHPYFAGTNTILRFADHFTRRWNVSNRFVIVDPIPGNPTEKWMTEAFPALSGSSVHRIRGFDELSSIPESDVTISTLWTTSYYSLRFQSTKRKFCFLQDYEPAFYPSGTTSAQAEAIYRFGFHAIANTPPLAALAQKSQGLPAHAFAPCVDTTRYRPHPRGDRSGEKPYRVIFYGRDDHPRNDLELGLVALTHLKKELGPKVEIICAGSDWSPREFGVEGVVENVGRLPYDQLSQFYGSADVGLVLGATYGPTYVLLEMLASGCAVVTNENPHLSWLLTHGKNCLLSPASARSMKDAMVRALTERELRELISAGALQMIRDRHSDWDAEIGSAFEFICDPERGRT